MNYQELDIEKICRTCMSQVDVTRSIFSIDETAGETVTLNDMLMSCTSVQVNQT